VAIRAARKARWAIHSVPVGGMEMVIATMAMVEGVIPPDNQSRNP